MRLGDSLIVVYRPNSVLRRDDRVRLNVCIRAGLIRIRVRLRSDGTPRSKDVAERAGEAAVLNRARIGAESSRGRVVGVDVVVLRLRRGEVLRLGSVLRDGVGELTVVSSGIPSGARGASGCVVASADVVAADVAGIARGFRRSRGASAVGIDSVGEGAGDPVEGRGRDAGDVVDKGE